ncbi:ectoine hydroxylase [Alicyclobacillus mengziensis]|nr:ectoine hydroxylase [Alicyclobacillus mengziensis]
MDLYPSRVSSTPSITMRHDPIIYSNRPQYNAGPLTLDELKLYEQNGYLLLENVFSEQEVANMLAELQSIWVAGAASDSSGIIREPESEEIRSVFAVHQNNTVFNRLSRDPRLIDVACQVLDSDVYVHQSRINFKPGFRGKDFYWHSDFETWHVEDGMPRMRAISFSVLLDDNLLYNGSLMLVPGSHRKFVACMGETPKDHYKESLRKQVFGVPDEESLTKLVTESGIDMPAGKKGSVLMFECNTMHGSNSNITPFARRNVFMVYNSVKNALQSPFSGGSPRPEFVASRAPQLVVI